MLTELTLKFYWPKYLVKYLDKIYGNSLQISDRCYAFRLLVGTKKPNFNNPPPKPDKDNVMLYKLNVPESYINKTDISYIKNVGSLHFINFIKGQFEEGLFIHVFAQKQIKELLLSKTELKKEMKQLSGLSVTNSVLSYCKKFDILEEDVKVETLLKAVHRQSGTGKHNNTKA